MHLRCVAPLHGKIQDKWHKLFCGGVKDKPKWMTIMKGSRAFEQAQIEQKDYGCVRTCVIGNSSCGLIRSLANPLWCNRFETTLFQTFKTQPDTAFTKLAQDSRDPEKRKSSIIIDRQTRYENRMNFTLRDAILYESARWDFHMEREIAPRFAGGWNFISVSRKRLVFLLYSPKFPVE